MGIHKRNVCCGRDFKKTMIKRLDNVKLNITENESKLFEIAGKKLGRRPAYFKILKKSLDARDKNNIFWVYSISFSDKRESDGQRCLERINTPKKIAVRGSGPAGLFCALRLIEHGFAPVIIERGEKAEDRRKTTLKFFC